MLSVWGVKVVKVVEDLGKKKVSKSDPVESMGVGGCIHRGKIGLFFFGSLYTILYQKDPRVYGLQSRSVRQNWLTERPPATQRC